jgi:hypothetical protein
MPPGCNWRANERAIYVSGSNVTLNGWDLTNTTVLIENGAQGTVTVIDCKATTGINIRSQVSAGANLVVRYCTFDGGGTAASSDFQTIQTWTPLTLEYCHIKNSPAASLSGKTTTIRYNAVGMFAWVTGAHANAFYLQGSNNAAHRVLVEYNTIWTGNTRNAQGFPIGFGIGVALFSDGGNYVNAVVANNTLISDLSGGVSHMLGFYTATGNSTSGTMRDNYMAWIPGGAFGAFYKSTQGTTNATYTGNINMRTGNVES